MSRSRAAAPAAALLTVLLLLSLAGPAAAARRPLLAMPFADPAVAPYDGGLVAVSTGWLGPRAVDPAHGTWRRTTTPALTRMPHWASGQGIWAADLHRIGRRWVLYFAAPVRGLGSVGHCIGVAVAPSPLAGFTPVGRPLVCPPGSHAAPADDRARRRAAPLPRGGVIDPSETQLGRRHYLIYKTQGIPSSIRMVPLSHDGLRAGSRSVQLLRARHTVENPVLLRRAHHDVLLTSEGSYGGCGYRTVWRSARSLGGLSRARPHTLLSSRSTGVCGPGGAVVVRSHVYFHGWACGADRRCAGGRDYARRSVDSSHRSLYDATLVWRQGDPRVRLGARHHHARPKHHRKHHRKHHHRRRHHHHR